MLFRRLSESAPRAALLTTLEGYVVSIVTHTLLIVSVVVPSSVEAPVSDQVPESFKWAEYLIPKDKPAGSKEVREHITYSQLVAPGGEGTLASDSQEPERLAIVKPEGVADDDLADVSEAPPPAPEVSGDTVMTVLEVDTAAARYDESAAPPYPPSLLAKRIEGSVAVQYVVDTTGRADTASFVVLTSTHDEFSQAVKRTLPEMRFRSAVMGSRKVRQLVQQLFTFKIDTTMIARQEAEKKQRKP
jgi:TonB family protein